VVEWKGRTSQDPTRRHVKRRSTSKVGGNVLCRGKSKVRQLDSHTAIRNQDVLRLQIAVVYPYRVAELYGIQYLKEDPLGQVVVTDVMASLRDIRKEITIGTEFNDDKGCIDGVHDLNQRNHVRMMAGLMVQLYLPLLEFPLSRIQSGFVQGLDGVKNAGVDIDGRVNDAISTNP